jgi:hypothetical protein
VVLAKSAVLLVAVMIKWFKLLETAGTVNPSFVHDTVYPRPMPVSTSQVVSKQLMKEIVLNY